MKKRIFTVFVLVALITCVIAPNARAEETGVTVKLPGFKVTLNGTVIDNKTSLYPLIVYRDITYFPMTYYGCRFLGLESIWNKGGGLTIAKSGANWGYHAYPAERPNSNTFYSARKADFPIKINGTDIDNTKEKYPLLLFRNITYLPLTWQFAAGEFGWNYSFDRTRGLVISSTDTGTAAEQLTLPITTRENGEKGAFTMAGDYFYFEGSNGIIYQASVENPLNKKKVYQLPKADYGAGYVYASLKTENGKALLSYHTGGTDAGPDYLIWLKEDGSSEKLDVNKAQSSNFITVDGMKYYTDSSGSLYKVPAAGGRPEKLAEGPVTHYSVLNGTIYYSLKDKNEQLYIYGNEEPVNPDGRLKSLEVQDGYMVAIFDKESKAQYKMMIFDGSGEVIYKTIEKVLLVRIENGKVVFVKDN